jgi:hypothetical protein
MMASHDKEASVYAVHGLKIAELWLCGITKKGTADCVEDVHRFQM